MTAKEIMSAVLILATAISCTRTYETRKIQLWDGGPSWADRNLGATSPEDCGEYFSWGESAPKEIYDWDHYTLCCDPAEGMDSGKAAASDAAHDLLGEGWSVPTEQDWEDLKALCKWEWQENGASSGYLVTGPNGNSIFLPAAGYRTSGRLRDDSHNGDYWSSSADSTDFTKGRDFYFHSEYCGIYSSGRDCGRSVRPIYR